MRELFCTTLYFISKLENVNEHLTVPTNIEKSNPTSTLPGAPCIMEIWPITHQISTTHQLVPMQYQRVLQVSHFSI